MHKWLFDFGHNCANLMPGQRPLNDSNEPVNPSQQRSGQNFETGGFVDVSGYSMLASLSLSKLGRLCSGADCMGWTQSLEAVFDLHVHSIHVWLAKHWACWETDRNTAVTALQVYLVSATSDCASDYLLLIKSTVFKAWISNNIHYVMRDPLPHFSSG